jgi:hypothetical protein
MTALFENLHTIQRVWVDNLEYQVKEGWMWLDPVLTLMRDYFFETTVVVTVILFYTIIFSAISLFSRQPQNKKITYTDEFKNLVKGVDLHLGDEPIKPLVKKPTKNKII